MGSKETLKYGGVSESEVYFKMSCAVGGILESLDGLLTRHYF